MNKAFIREPELDGRAYCPRCGALGTAVDRETLDHHVQKQARLRLADSAWYCEFAECDTGYFDQFDRVVSISELEYPVYPKASAAPICACFGFTFEDLEAGKLRHAVIEDEDIVTLGLNQESRRAIPSVAASITYSQSSGARPTKGAWRVRFWQPAFSCPTGCKGATSTEERPLERRSRPERRRCLGRPCPS